MGDGASNFKIILTLEKSENNNSSVHFKVDGTRFLTENTLKLNVETSYVMTASFRPPQVLVDAALLGSHVTPKEKSRDHNGSTYVINWSSNGIGVTKHGKRDKIPVVFELKHVGQVLLNLQTKFYSVKDAQHSTWGTNLHQIEFECQVSSASGSILVSKEIFR